MSYRPLGPRSRTGHEAPGPSCSRFWAPWNMETLSAEPACQAGASLPWPPTQRTHWTHHQKSFPPSPGGSKQHRHSRGRCPAARYGQRTTPTDSCQGTCLRAASPPPQKRRGGASRPHCSPGRSRSDPPPAVSQAQAGTGRNPHAPHPRELLSPPWPPPGRGAGRTPSPAGAEYKARPCWAAGREPQAQRTREATGREHGSLKPEQSLPAPPAPRTRPTGAARSRVPESPRYLLLGRFEDTLVQTVAQL